MCCWDVLLGCVAGMCCCYGCLAAVSYHNLGACNHAHTYTHQNTQIDHVKAERNVLTEVQNNFVVKLYYSFQDDDFLYLIMEYLPGGDVMVWRHKGVMV